jgi:hypothetical protein
MEDLPPKHPSARFTDATSNFGWFVAFWAVRADRAMSDAKKIFIA